MLVDIADVLDGRREVEQRLGPAQFEHELRTLVRRRRLVERPPQV
jgi:hypothetical protein